MVAGALGERVEDDLAHGFRVGGRAGKDLLRVRWRFRRGGRGRAELVERLWVQEQVPARSLSRLRLSQIWI